MKRIAIGGVLFALAFGAQAFGEVGQWSEGFGQGNFEYVGVVNKNTNLYIACNSGDNSSMTLTVNGKESDGFTLIVDGKEIDAAYETESRVGSDNFKYALEKMRKAKSVQAKTSDGKVVDLPVKKIGILPSPKSKNFSCQTTF